VIILQILDWICFCKEISNNFTRLPLKPNDKHLKIILFAGLILTGLVACNSSNSEKPLSKSSTKVVSFRTPGLPPLPDQEKQKLHNEIENILRGSLYRTNFNGGILVAKSGTIVYENYVGFKNPRRRDDSITANTPFQIASTSKTITSTAVLKLVQEGKINLQDSVQKYFPALPYHGITVEMLLNHRSGLPNYLYYVEKAKDQWDRKKLMTNQDVVNTLINWHPPVAAYPNRRFNYCNTNFVLLAAIVEKVSGMPFPEYVKKNIFDPLGMDHTHIHTIDDTANVIQSYQRNGALWTLDYSDGPYGDKNVYTTPRDLLKWDQSFYTHSILDQPILDSAYTPYSHERPGIKNYGLGWRLLIFPNGKKVEYHNGHWHGFNSAFARLTDEKATIIIVSNNYNNAIYNIARRLYNVFANYDGRQEEGEE
jgi:CubicO group peptidase (beta-lactamase class C family)